MRQRHWDSLLSEDNSRHSAPAIFWSIARQCISTRSSRPLQKYTPCLYIAPIPFLSQVRASAHNEVKQGPCRCFTTPLVQRNAPSDAQAYGGISAVFGQGRCSGADVDHAAFVHHCLIPSWQSRLGSLVIHILLYLTDPSRIKFISYSLCPYHRQC